MNGKKLALNLALLCLLGPVEPVFADGDINSQFPDVGIQSSSSSSSSSFSSSNNPWAVETWSGGRRREKRFNGNNANQGFNNNSSWDRPMRRRSNDAAQYQNSATSYSPLDRSSPALDRLNAMSNGLSNGMPLGAGGMDVRPRRPDKFADNPQVDDSGIRHFANGRHYDLKATSMDQALADSAASDDQIKQEQMLARMRQRARNGNF